MARSTQSMPGADAGELDEVYVELGDSSSLQRPALAAGSTLGGKYRLISEIGRGGMGSVWRAEHLGWEAPVAVKIMSRTNQPEGLARFEREVRLAAGLRSPHVVQVLDHGIDEATRTPFIAMELLEGETLAKRLKRLKRLSPAETFSIVSQLVRALVRAHAAGIVHRDLKPDNVFLVRNEDEVVAKVLDFGVAKWTAPSLPREGLTRPGNVLGTPFYMSPEQIQGSNDIDHRADLWSLSVIACECLTGKRPFEARDFAQLAVLLIGNQGRRSPSSLGPVPAGFDAWFARATHPIIDKRFQNARELARELAPLCGAQAQSAIDDVPNDTEELPGGHNPASMSPVSHTAAPGYPPRRVFRWSPFVITTLSAFVVVSGAIFYWYRGVWSPPVAATAETAAPPPAAAAAAPTLRAEPAPPVVAAPPAVPAPTQPPTPPAPAAEQGATDATGEDSAEIAPADRGTRPVSSPPASRTKGARPNPARAKARPATSRPPASPAAPATSPAAKSELDVNGRRIRTSLSPSQ